MFPQVPNSHLFAVRKKTRKKIIVLEENQELVEKESVVWNALQREVDDLKRKLFRLEFMIYNGGEE